MSLQAARPAVVAVSSSLWHASCSYTNTQRTTKRKTHFLSLACSKHTKSSSNKLIISVCSILSGAVNSAQPPQSLNAMILLHLRRWQACRSRRRKRRRCGKQDQFKCNNNHSTSSSVITVRKIRNCVISCHASSSSNRNCVNTATTRRILLHADYTECGLLQARNTNWQPAAKAAEVEAELEWCSALHTREGAATATTQQLSKLLQCARLTSRRKSEQQMCPQQTTQPQPTTDEYLPACLLQQEQQTEQQQQQQPQLQQAAQPQLPGVAALHARLQANVDQICSAGGHSKSIGMQCDQLQQYQITHEHPQKQHQQLQQHCLHAPVIVQKRQAAKEMAHQRSWPNLIGCVESGTNATAATTKATLTKNATITSSLPLNNAVPATTATNAATKTTCSPATGVAIKATAKAKAPKTPAKSVTTTTQIMPSQQHVPNVSARKSKCRRTFALTSRLTTTPTPTTTTTKKTMAIKATKTATATATAKKTSTRLAVSRTPAALFGDILTLFVGALTLHATVLRCVLITAVVATTASVTAAPFVPQNTQLSLSQQMLQTHFHNNNYNNSNSYYSSSNSSTFNSASAHNYNHRHSLLPAATPAPFTPPAALLRARMLDIEVLNGSTSESNNGRANANILKSLSSIIEAAEMGEVDVNQLPIFDFGLPRNITARTGQAEATIKCRVERLDDKSVSWIRKRDLHILTVATATYTSDKRFQVTSSKDGREWILHVKSPQARDSGIYECQVNTEPKMSMAFQLNIIEIPADSRAIISGPADLHFKVGSAIILNCHVQQPSVRDIGPIYWYRGDHIITPFEVNDEESEGAPQQRPPALSDNELDVDVTAAITNANALAVGRTGRLVYAAAATSVAASSAAAAATAQHDGLTNDITPDFTARIAMESQLGDTMKSRLRISNAQTTDTGNYTCQPTTASSASVMVHVINDENPAAMQKSSASAVHTATAATTRRRVNMTLTLLMALTVIKTIMTRANVITSTAP